MHLIYLLFPIALTMATAHAQHFRVQIIASDAPVPPEYFEKHQLKNVWCTKDETGIYRYYTGSYNTRIEAEAIRKELLAKDYTQATIIDLEEQRLLADDRRCGYFKGGPVSLAESDSVQIVYFETGKAALSSDARKKIGPIVNRMKTEPDLALYILGYSDAVGTAAANMGLAVERARAVRNFLLDNNIDPLRMYVYAYGETEAGNIEDTALVGNEYERAQLRKRFRCAVLVLKKRD